MTRKALIADLKRSNVWVRGSWTLINKDELVSMWLSRFGITEDIRR